MADASATLLVLPDGRRFLLGLVWSYLPNLAGATRQAEARQLVAKKRAAMGVIVHERDHPMVGYTAGAPRSYKGVPSAAALARTWPTKRLIVAPINPERTQYWLCIAGAGDLDHELDTVVAAERARHIVQELLTLASAGSNTMVLGIHEDTDLDMPWFHGEERHSWETLLPPVDPSPFAVKPLNTRSAREHIALLVLAGLPLAFLGNEASTYYARREAARDELEALARASEQNAEFATNAALAEAAERQAVADALLGDSRTPEPAAAFDACRAAFRGVGRTFAGWSVRRVRCDALAGQVLAELAITHPAAPTYGTVARLQRAAGAAGGQAAVAASLRSATLALPLPPVAQRPGVADVALLPSWGDILGGPGDVLLRRARGDGAFSFALAEPAPRPITYVDPVGFSADGAPTTVEVPSDRGYRSASLTLSAPYGIARFVEAFSAPTSRVDSVEWTPESNAQTTTLTLLVHP
jgi:hypothetical protein